MFKIAKLEKVKNESINIKLFKQEKNRYENEKKISETFKSLSFYISNDEYSFSFDLNCELKKLLEIPMNQTINFNSYILDGSTFLVINGVSYTDIKMDIKINRYLKNKFSIFLTFFTNYTFEEKNDYSGMIEITFNLDDYLDENND